MFSSRMKLRICTQTSLYSLYSTVDETARHIRVFQQAGFFGAGSSTTEQFAQQVQVLRAAQAEPKQDTRNFQIAKRVYIAIDDNTTRAHERVEGELKRIYGASGLSKVAVYGPPSACIAGLREVVDAGAQLIQLHLLFDDTEQMDRLATEVIPQLG